MYKQVKIVASVWADGDDTSTWWVRPSLNDHYYMHVESVVGRACCYPARRIIEGKFRDIFNGTRR